MVAVLRDVLLLSTFKDLERGQWAVSRLGEKRAIREKDSMSR